MSEENDNMTPEEANNKRKYFKSVFNKFDANKNDEIELCELVELLKTDNEVPKIISNKIFEAADKNENGVLDFKEFEKMVQDENYKEAFYKYINTYIKYVLPKPKYIDEIDALYEEKYSCCPPPVALILISALEITFFIMDEASRKDSDRYADGPTAKLFIYNPHKRQEAWRYLTYMFVHIGYTHLTVNLIVQLTLGVPLEMVHKCWRILVVYFSGVIAGSLATSVVDPGTYLAGASGGVYALITAHVGTIFMNWNDMECPLLQLAVFLIIIIVDVGSSIYNRYFLNLQENIGYAAHLGGAIAGLLVGIWNLKNFDPSRKETYIWWCALTIYIICMCIMVVLNIFWKDHFLSNSKNVF